MFGRLPNAGYYNTTDNSAILYMQCASWLLYIIDSLIDPCGLHSTNSSGFYGTQTANYGKVYHYGGGGGMIRRSDMLPDCKLELRITTQILNANSSLPQKAVDCLINGINSKGPDLQLCHPVADPDKVAMIVGGSMLSGMFAVFAVIMLLMSGGFLGLIIKLHCKRSNALKHRDELLPINSGEQSTYGSTIQTLDSLNSISADDVLREPDADVERRNGLGSCV